MHDFGDNVNRVVAPTTREAGSKQAINLQVMHRENEESKTSTSGKSRDMSENARKRGEAVAELDREKD